MVVALAVPAGAECWCFNGQPGELGFSGPTGDVGDVIGLSFMIHTITDVSAWGVDIAYPSDRLNFLYAVPGDLTQGWIFGFNPHPTNPDLVRVGAFAGVVGPGVVGALTVLWFLVEDADNGELCVHELFDDIHEDEGYFICDGSEGPTSIPGGAEALSWGTVKSLYR
jgi:hypothetical protein